MCTVADSHNYCTNFTGFFIEIKKKGNIYDDLQASTTKPLSLNLNFGSKQNLMKVFPCLLVPLHSAIHHEHLAVCVTKTDILCSKFQIQIGCRQLRIGCRLAGDENPN
ncbi:hypothetical protein MRX96_041122 [Rhipicephalus microplus]